MPRLAVDVLDGVAIDGVAADDDHRVGRAEMEQDIAGQGAAQAQARRGGPREDALVVGPVPGRERPEGAQQGGDGVGALREDGGHYREHDRIGYHLGG